MKIQLNLATGPQANNRPFLAGSALIGAAAVIALVLLAHAAYSSWQDQRQLRSEISALQSRIRTSEVQQQQLAAYFHGPQAQRVLDRSAFLNSLIDERSFPWTRIFTDLERTLPPGVRVISISPKLDNGRAEVKLEIGAENGASEVQFLKAMETSHAFSGLVVREVKPATGTAAAGADSGDNILINLSVWYSTI
jgi:Tfp pilus assembly protein PilN